MGKLENKTYWSIEQCNQQAREKLRAWVRQGYTDIKAFPIPRGGYAASAHFLEGAKNLCNFNIVNFDEAEYYIDDIVDTGATYERWKAKRDLPIISLIDQTDDLQSWHVFPWELQDESRGPADAVARMISYIGDDINREGLVHTPERVIKSFEHLYSGYGKDPNDLIKPGAGLFEEHGDTKSPVILKDVEVYSTCEHHMLPFYGKAHIAYLPTKNVIGVSKLARLLEIYARRLQIQERIGEQVTDWLYNYLPCEGALCILECQHFCMTSRGVEKQNSIMVTSSLKGAFMTNTDLRQEVMGLIKHG